PSTAVRAVIPGARRPTIVRLLRILRPVSHLRLVAELRQVTVEKARGDLVRPYRRDRRRADAQLPTTVRRRPDDRLGRDFRLIDRRHRLRLARQPALDPVELRRVHRPWMPRS